MQRVRNSSSSQHSYFSLGYLRVTFPWPLVWVAFKCFPAYLADPSPLSQDFLIVLLKVKHPCCLSNRAAPFLWSRKIRIHEDFLSLFTPHLDFCSYFIPPAPKASDVSCMLQSYFTHLSFKLCVTKATERWDTLFRWFKQLSDLLAQEEMWQMLSVFH